MRVLKKLLWILVILLIVIGGAGYFISKKYDSIVQNAIIYNLNQQLTTSVAVKKVHLSVWSSFPFASLDFEDVWIQEAAITMGEPDTLFYFKNLKLNFSLLDLYHEKYEINKIVGEGGIAKLKVFKDGTDNYHFFKPGADTSSKQFSMVLEGIELENVKAFYRDEQNGDLYSGHIKNLSAEGNFSSESFELTLNGTIDQSMARVRNTTYLPESSLKLNTAFHVGTDPVKITFSRGQATVNDLLSFNLSGEITPPEYDLLVAGNKIDFESTLHLLPSSIQQYFEKIDATGVVDIKGRIKGNADTDRPPFIAAGFSLNKGSLHYHGRKEKFENLSFSGNFKTGDNGSLRRAMVEVNDLHASISKGRLLTKFTIHNMVKPRIKGYLAWDFLLENAIEAWPLDTVESISGKVKLATELSIDLQKWAVTKSDLKTLHSSGEMIVSGFNLALVNTKQQVTNANGTLRFYEDKLKLEGVNGQFGQSDFAVNGLAKNVFASLLFKEENLVVDAQVKSKRIKVEDLFVRAPSEQDTGEAFVLPKKLTARVRAEIDSLSFKNFKADSVSGIFTLKPGYFSARKLTFNAMQGKGQGNLTMRPVENNRFKFSTLASFESIAIDELFHVFENFGQETLESRHLNGTATASISATGNLTRNLGILDKTIVGEMNLNVNRGGLIGFEPLDEVTAYFESHFLLKRLIDTDRLRKELDHVEFSNLQNTIQCKNGQVTIPQMHVSTSALDIEFEGHHDFSNQMDYHMKFNFRDLMMKKERSTEFGEIEDDGLGGKLVFLSITGTPEDFDIEWDRKRNKEHKQQVVKSETEEIKQILKEEFSGEKQAQPVEEKEFEIEWEEFDTDTAKQGQPAEPQDTAKKEKKLKKFFDKLLEEPEKKGKKPEVVFEDDF